MTIPWLCQQPTHFHSKHHSYRISIGHRFLFSCRCQQNSKSLEMTLQTHILIIKCVMNAHIETVIWFDPMMRVTMITGLPKVVVKNERKQRDGKSHITKGSIEIPKPIVMRIPYRKPFNAHRRFFSKANSKNIFSNNIFKWVHFNFMLCNLLVYFVSLCYFPVAAPSKQNLQRARMYT